MALESPGDQGNHPPHAHDSGVLDVVVLGGGGAGCAAIFRAQERTLNVLLISKGDLSESKTAQAQGGIQAAMSPDDSPDSHFEDTMKAGKGMSDPALVKKLTSRAGDAVRWLESMGVRFDREGADYRLQTAAGLSRPRVLSVGDTAGRGIVEVLLRELKRRAVPTLEHFVVHQVDRRQGGFEITGIQRGAEAPTVLRTRSIVFATGSFIPRDKAAGLVKKLESEAPDGLDLAGLLGAEIVHPDLVQYHPTGVVWPPSLRRKRLPETMRSSGAVFRNKHGEIFVNAMETRGVLTQAIVEECEKGNGIATEDGRQGVWLDTPAIDAQHGEGFTAERFPRFHALFLEAGHDLTRHSVLVYPILHYSLGGVRIDENAATSVHGVFAAGEVAWGVHGMERLMGNSLLDIFVFGQIAGISAAEYALKQRHV